MWLFCFGTEIDLLGDIDLPIVKRNEGVGDADVYKLTRVGDADLWWLLWWLLKKAEDGLEKLELVEEAKPDDEEEEILLAV